MGMISSCVLAAAVVQSTYLKTPEEYKYICPTQTLGTVISGDYVYGCVFPRLENQIIFTELFYRMYYDINGAWAPKGFKDYPENYTTNSPLLQSSPNSREVNYNLNEICKLVADITKRSTNLNFSVGYIPISGTLQLHPVAGFVTRYGGDDLQRILHENVFATNNIPAAFSEDTCRLCSEYIQKYQHDPIITRGIGEIYDSILGDLANITLGVASEWPIRIHEDTHSVNYSYKQNSGYNVAQTNQVFAGTSLDYILQSEKTRERTVFDGGESEDFSSSGIMLTAKPIEIDIDLDSSLAYFKEYGDLKKPEKDYVAYVILVVDVYEKHSKNAKGLPDESCVQIISTNYMWKADITNIRRANGEYAHYPDVVNRVIGTITIPTTEIFESINKLLWIRQGVSDDPTAKIDFKYTLEGEGSLWSRLSVSIGANRALIFCKSKW